MSSVATGFGFDVLLEELWPRPASCIIIRVCCMSLVGSVPPPRPPRLLGARLPSTPVLTMSIRTFGSFMQSPSFGVVDEVVLPIKVCIIIIFSIGLPVPIPPIIMGAIMVMHFCVVEDVVVDVVDELDSKLFSIRDSSAEPIPGLTPPVTAT